MLPFGEKPGKNGKKRKKPRRKIGILLKSNHTLTYEFVANESSFGIYTRKTKQILFEI